MSERRSISGTLHRSFQETLPLPGISAPGLIGHLDLKGVQLRPAALFEYLEYFARCGYQALLVEYEDIFPYQSVDVALHREEVWTNAFLKAFLAKAEALGLEIIPLQQTLGHLEYAFRWKRYRSLCLPVGYPSTVNVGMPEAREWVKTMLREVISAHPQCRYIHLGMDEAYALVSSAEKAGREPLEPFLDYLDEICRVCEEAGRQPVIWADMLERYIAPAQIAAIHSFSKRVALISWHYHGPWRARRGLHPTVRFGGHRASSLWLEQAREEDVPEHLSDGIKSFDGWPREIAALAKPYRVGEKWVKAYFPAAIWKEMGFKVWGGCGVVTSADGAVLPSYHRRMNNVDTWAEACHEYRLDGLVVTAWARGDTCRAPHALPDAIAPLWEYAAAKAGKCFEVFVPGVPRERLWNLLWKAGRSQDGWHVYRSVRNELAELGRTLSHPDPRWQRLGLLLEILSIRSELEQMLEECEKRFFAHRLMASEWEMRVHHIEAGAKKLISLREQAGPLLEAYHGHALEEWLTLVFGQPLEKCAQVCEAARKMHEEALSRYES